MLTILILISLFRSAGTVELTIDAVVTCAGTPQPLVEAEIWTLFDQYSESNLTATGKTDSTGRLYIKATVEKFDVFSHIAFKGINCQASGDNFAIRHCNGTKDRVNNFEFQQWGDWQTYPGPIDLLNDCVFDVMRKSAVRVRGRLTCNANGMPLANTKLQLRDGNYMLSDVLLASTKTDNDGNYDMLYISNTNYGLEPVLYVLSPNCTSRGTAGYNICNGKEDGNRRIQVDEGPSPLRIIHTRNINLYNYCHYVDPSKTPKLYFYASGKFLCKGKPIPNINTVALYERRKDGDILLQVMSIMEGGLFEAFGGRGDWYFFSLDPYIQFSRDYCRHCNATKKIEFNFPNVQNMVARKCGKIDLFDYCQREGTQFKLDCPLD